MILLCSHFNGKILIIVRLAMAERVIVKIRRPTVDYAMIYIPKNIPNKTNMA